MFSIKEFCKKGLISAVGKMPDYWVYNNAMGWHEKGVLDENDLAEIQTAIEAQHLNNENITNI
jgi:hypothetical protein